jgi:hypothetical protein
MLRMKKALIHAMIDANKTRLASKALAGVLCLFFGLSPLMARDEARGKDEPSLRAQRQAAREGQKPVRGERVMPPGPRKELAPPGVYGPPPMPRAAPAQPASSQTTQSPQPGPVAADPNAQRAQAQAARQAEKQRERQELREQLRAEQTRQKPVSSGAEPASAGNSGSGQKMSDAERSALREQLRDSRRP